jgi:hypothetical protein
LLHGYSPSTARLYCSRGSYILSAAGKIVSGGTAPLDEAAPLALSWRDPQQAGSFAAGYRRLQEWLASIDALLGPPLPATAAKALKVAMPDEDVLQVVRALSTRYPLASFPSMTWTRPAPHTIPAAWSSDPDIVLCSTGEGEVVKLQLEEATTLVTWAGEAVAKAGGPLLPDKTGGLKPAPLPLLRRWLR